jgi:hypothetical protein
LVHESAGLSEELIFREWAICAISTGSMRPSLNKLVEYRADNTSYAAEEDKPDPAKKSEKV